MKTKTYLLRTLWQTFAQVLLRRKFVVIENITSRGMGQRRPRC